MGRRLKKGKRTVLDKNDESDRKMKEVLLIKK